MRKAYRVKSEVDFQKVFHQGKSKANRQFVVYKLPKEGQKHFRVGISVGTKLGNAVTRNKIKRRIRHALMELDKEQTFHHELDFIVIARAPVKQMSFHEIKKSLLHVLSLANVIIKNK
jgi:ribonuclease P protein component